MPRTFFKVGKTAGGSVVSAIFLSGLCQTEKAFEDGIIVEVGTQVGTWGRRVEAGLREL